ncbi:AP2/ERF and B3 domain-containing transcription factor At1g50680-like isoform X1 [Euphorbia lathyris]|uniref:AP2/ERF and B3 domain-containing transcription factor At1g50680-like isoform X1 n=2 Tax=Euphorbia lathyris TaxID=212925 RepID=UPI0033139839
MHSRFSFFSIVLFTRLCGKIEKAMELNLRLNMSINSSNSNFSNDSGSASKFGGVIWLRSGKWGARIAYKYKAYWLGTYDMEEEAATAYDRAAIKLQRSDTPLNFHMQTYTVQETKFQGLYSNEEILEMIKNKTYITKFSSFLANQSLVREFNASNPSRRYGGISYQLLFQKELTQTDVTHIKGLYIPKVYAMGHFPPLAGVNSETREGGERMSTELIFYDKHCRPWTFGYSYWKSTQTFVFTKGWRHFLRMNSLKPRDSVFFYICKQQRDNQRKTYYVIDVQRAGTELYGLCWIIDMENDFWKNINKGIEVVEMKEETDNEVKLFGVQIGRRVDHKRKRTEE